MPEIINQRAFLAQNNSPSGVLASGDQIGEIEIPTTGLYMIDVTVAATTTLAAPRAVALRLATPLTALAPLTLTYFYPMGLHTTGGWAHKTIRALLRDRIDAGGTVQGDLVRTHMATILAVGENLWVVMNVVLLAPILTGGKFEQLAPITIEDLKRLSLWP